MSKLIKPRGRLKHSGGEGCWKTEHTQWREEVRNRTLERGRKLTTLEVRKLNSLEGGSKRKTEEWREEVKKLNIVKKLKQMD